MGRLDRLALELNAAALDLRGHLAWVRFRRCLDRELRYREDQPRAPRGVPIGGQWIDDTVRVDRDRVDVAARRSRSIEPRCVGFPAACPSGSKASSMFIIDGKRLCWDCAIKFLGIRDLSFDEQWKTLTDYDATLRE